MATEDSEAAAMQRVKCCRASARPQRDAQGPAAGCREEPTGKLTASVITGFKHVFLGTSIQPQVSQT